MPLKLASKTQVSGHFFVRRRLGFALLRRSVSMEVDPVRWQRTLLMLSAVLGVVLVVGAFVYGWFRPAGVVGNSKIVADRRSGALSVSVNGRLHPALNLVSAQLIAGEPDAPTFVSGAEIAKAPKGAPVGIVGAPVEVPAVQSPEVARWAVCDTAPSSVGGAPVVTGIDGELALGQQATEMGGDAAVVLSYQQRAYLVVSGVRMPLDLGDAAVTAALGVHTAAAAPMSRALFDALPAGRPLVVPVVPEAGAPTRVDLGANLVVGTVVASRDVATGADQFYVVLVDGVQPVSPVVAAMLRHQNSYGLATPLAVSPDRLARVPIRRVLDVDHYPKSPVRLADTGAQPVTCVAWRWGVNERQARWSVITGAGLPIKASQQGHLVSLVGGGRQGIVANQVLLGDGASTFVTTTGSAVDSPARETMWLIAATGTRYGVAFDQNTMQALGLQASRVRPVPWSMLQVWAAGPELSRTAALTVHDSLDTGAAIVTSTTAAAGG